MTDSKQEICEHKCLHFRECKQDCGKRYACRICNKLGFVCFCNDDTDISIQYYLTKCCVHKCEKNSNGTFTCSVIHPDVNINFQCFD